MSKRTLVLGLGNILLKDEGIGVHVVRQLEKKPLPQHVQTIDGGTFGLDVFSYLEGIQRLIIIDAVKMGKPPGSIHELQPKQLDYDPTNTLSLHQIGAVETLSLVERTCGLPEEVLIIGIEPKEIKWGLEPTEDIQEKIPQVVDLVLERIA